MALTATDLDAVPGAADDRYFLAVFGSESTPKTAAKTHVFATVARVVGGTVVESHTISWVPATADIHPYRFKVEPGKNFGLQETLQFCDRTGQRVAMWGPFEIGPRPYHRFLVQKEFLDSGGVGYQCLDAVGEAHNGSGCNCIHAVTDMDPRYGRANYPLIFFGQSAAHRFVRRIVQSPAVIDPPQAHGWVAAQLGLDGSPIERKCYTGPIGPK